MVNFLVDENPNRLISVNADFGLTGAAQSSLFIPAPAVATHKVGIHQFYLGANETSASPTWALRSNSVDSFGGLFASILNTAPVEWDYSPWPWYFGEAGSGVRLGQGASGSLVSYRLFVTYAVYTAEELSVVGA